MRYCKRCVQPDTRPNIYFNKEGVCGACLYQEDVEQNIDWKKREAELLKIRDWAKEKAIKNNSNYECVVGVSGGKDSTVQALYAKNKLKLRTLLVNCEPEGLSDIGKLNIENLKNKGFDVISIRPNPVLMKKLIKRDFYTHVNPVKVTEFPLWAVTYRMAGFMKIPLIIQGENDCLTLGVRNKQGLGGNAMLITEQDTLASGHQEYLKYATTEEDLFFYHFDKKLLKENGTKAIWLQYYMKNWSQSRNAKFAIKHGLTIRKPDFKKEDYGTYSPYFQLDGSLTALNQMLKYIKFGFGQCTDHACYDIRDGLITREEGIELVKKYDGKCSSKFIKNFCDFIGISLTEFWDVANSVRGNMWKNKNFKWKLRNPIWEQV